ncbi:MAG TPA: sugar transferase [Fodinibius sp.]|nr:sugar transferase [Fodinibius sp.]
MKRPADLLVVSLGLLVLSPVIILVAVVSRMQFGKGIFFKQKRIGLHEHIFTIVKFRTMTNEKDEEGNLLPDEERITRYGAFLRKTSLDELPQLWNVLKGDMSIIGPRPLFVRYLDYYTDREKKRHWARPGITGLAQVSGRNNLGWDSRLELDVRYVENIALLLDLKIICKTVLQVLKGEDVRVVPGKDAKPLNIERKEKIHEQ